MGRKLDLMRKKFGRLTVLEDVGRDKRGAVLWKCLCECGEKTIVQADNLSSGNTKSCGCLNRDMCHARTGEKSQNWKGGRTTNSKGYVKVCVPGHPRASKNNYVYEHTFVMEKLLGRYLEPGEMVHHKNEKRGDNRPENLKLFATRGEHFKYHAEMRRQRKLLGNIWQVIKELVPAAAEM